MAGEGFYILDAAGNRKLTSFGSGASLPDPVTVAHGGTGLTTVAQGDLLYGSAAGVISRLAKDAAGVRILTNLGPSHDPIWSDPLTAIGCIPRPTSRKSGWHESLAAAAFTNVALASTVSNNANVVDATSCWIRFTTGAVSGNQAGHRTTADIMWLDHLPMIEVVLRTGVSIASCTIWICLNNAAALISNNADQHLLKGIGFRFDSAADAGMWVPWASDGTTQQIGTAVAAIAAATVYTLKFWLTGTTLHCTVNNGTEQTLTIGAAALATLMRLNAQITTTAAGAKILDVASIYHEWN